MSSFMEEVVGPHLIWMLWPQTDARSIVGPEPASLWVLWQNLQPFLSPETLYPLVVHC